MSLNHEIVDELRLLTLFNLASIQEGIKVHSDAEPNMIAAAERLWHKNLITQKDGGYLTDLGIEAVECIQKAITILSN